MSGPPGERISSVEPEGLPEDLFTNPAKYDGDIPLWRKTVGLIKQYQTARPNNRGKILDQFAQPLVINLAGIGQVLENLDLIAQIKPDEGIETTQRMLSLHLESVISRRASLSSWTPGRIEELIKIGLTGSDQSKPIIERLKAALFNAPRTIDEATGLHYDTAWAMVSTTNEEVRQELFSILCYEKDWFPTTSNCAFLATQGAIFSSDSNVKKYTAIDDAVRLVGRYLEIENGVFPDSSIRVNQRDQSLISANNFISHDEQLQRSRILNRLIGQNGDKVQKILSYLSTKPWESDANKEIYISGQDITSFADSLEKHKRAEAEHRNCPYPQNLMHAEDPLKALTRDIIAPKAFKTAWGDYVSISEKKGFRRVTAKPFELGGNFELDILAKNIDSAEQAAALLREVHQTLLTGDCPNPLRNLATSFAGILEAAELFPAIIVGAYDTESKIKLAIFRKEVWKNVGKLASVIEYHRPVISTEEVGEIENQNSRLRENIKNEFTCSVGRRGYHILISDPALRQYGYQSIELKVDSKTNVIHSTLEIDSVSYKYKIGPDFRIIPGEDIMEFQSHQDQAWLELLTLSHLKKVMCTGPEEADIVPELVGGQEQYVAFKKQMVHINEHLRWYKNSKRKYSQEAFVNCLTSGLLIKNLHTINQMRAGIGWGGTAETGWWTYVKGAEFDIDTQAAKPVKVAYKTATDDIRQVIPLGEISQEEIARIEREILAELAA